MGGAGGQWFDQCLWIEALNWGSVHRSFMKDSKVNFLKIILTFLFRLFLLFLTVVFTKNETALKTYK